MSSFDELHQSIRTLVRSKTQLPFCLDMYGGRTITAFIKIFENGLAYTFMAQGTSVPNALEKLLVQLSDPAVNWQFNYGVSR